MAILLALATAILPCGTHAATFVVVNTTDAGVGSLRQAITDANASAGADTIAFAIPALDVPRVTLASALPTITDPVTIDGTTQLPAGWVEIDGQATSAAAGLTVTAGGSTIRGLVIGAFGAAGIVLAGAGGNVVEHDRIGTDASGTQPRSPLAYGIEVSGSPGNRIGGTSLESANVISGNLFGVFVHGGAAAGNVIEGNLIGTSADGDAALPNWLGVWIFGAGDTVLGGDAIGAGNIVAGNSTDGIDVGGAIGTVVAGNLVGVAADGVTPLGNGADGVYVYGGTAQTVVGGTTANRIENNAGSGVQIADGTGNAVRANVIDQNGSLGVDVGPAGVTPNDPGDADVGANGLQNFPVLDGAFAGGTAVSGTLDSTPDTTFTVEVFATPACDPSGYGEGEELLATLMVSTDGTGHVDFTAMLSRSVDASREQLTATATDPSGNTSEFSACTPATPLTTTTTTSTSTTTSPSSTSTTTTTTPTTTSTSSASSMTTSTSTTTVMNAPTTSSTGATTTSTTDPAGSSTTSTTSTTTTTSAASSTTTTSTSTTTATNAPTTSSTGATTTSTTDPAGSSTTSTSAASSTTTSTSTTTATNVPTTTSTGATTTSTTDPGSSTTTTTSGPSSTTTTTAVTTTTSTDATTTSSTTPDGPTTTSTAPASTTTTTVTTREATTTTTVPGPCEGCRCVVRPTFDSIACRLEMLRDSTPGMPELDGVRAKVDARLAQGALLLAKARSRCAGGRRAGAARKLIALDGRLRRIPRMVGLARRDPVSPLREFAGTASEAGNDARRLARGLSCP